MFDILVYLFESYIHADACPEPDQLTRKLSAAGYGQEKPVADNATAKGKQQNRRVEFNILKSKKKSGAAPVAAP